MDYIQLLELVRYESQRHVEQREGGGWSGQCHMASPTTGLNKCHRPVTWHVAYTDATPPVTHM